MLGIMNYKKEKRVKDKLSTLAVCVCATLTNLMICIVSKARQCANVGMKGNMVRRQRLRSTLSFFLAATMLFTPIQSGKTVSAAENKTTADYEEIVGSYSVDKSIKRYTIYKEGFDNVKPSDEYRIEAKDYVYYIEGELDSNGKEIAVKPKELIDYERMDGTSVIISETGFIEYEVDIKNAGFYDISLTYYPIEGKNSEIQRSFFIDGELPYDELALVEFSRVWSNNITEFYLNKDGIMTKKWEKDNQGNDLKPTLYETPEWITSYLYDSNGYVINHLSVYFTEGVHKISMLSLREPMLLRRITLNNTTEVVDYKTKKAEWDGMNAKDTSGILVRVEAESVTKTSSQMLYPKQDQSSPAVYPSSTKELLNNTIGGNSWRLTGQWMEWDFEVPETGYYNIGFFTKQNFVRGIYVSRKITIDGKVLFNELSDYGFRYQSNWRFDSFMDENKEAYKIYLEAGSHTLRMQNVLGEFSSIIGEVQESLSKLNAIYRKIIRITGVKPDIYSDYQIEAKLPELEAELIDVHNQLDSSIKHLREVAGGSSDKEAVLVTMRDQLEDLIKDQEYFKKVVTSYKINVRAVGTWLSGAVSQPLQLDAIYIYSPDVDANISRSSFWSKLWYEICRLFYSFIIDYNQIGNVSEKGKETHTITLWVGTGRDQANVIKSLIDETFTKRTGINVNVMLVDMGTLLQATLAGQGPDVAIQLNISNPTYNSAIQSSNDMPMNYGLRNAVADLSQFSDLKEVRERFFDSAMVPFTYQNHTFALPETQTFPMMFYRKDILKELGLTLPQTWDDVKVIMSVLAKNQMEFGMLPNELNFLMLLNQFGGQYYNEDATKSALDSDEGINAFKEYCSLYTEYKLDKVTSVEDRFRTGECPIIIADYSVYNNFQVSAPDIKGLWGFAPVPGMRKEDGTINRNVASVGSACIIMEASKYKEDSWEFIKWWTSAEVQTLYGKEMESLMGASARVATANKEAFERLPWPSADYTALKKQFESVVGTRQVPGGYFTWRNIDNAFYKVTTNTDSASARECLMDNIIYINDEINYKRKEFHMPLAND